MISSYLPAVRIHNDLEDGLLSDYEDENFELPTNNGYSPRDQYRDARPLTALVVDRPVSYRARKSLEHRSPNENSHSQSWYSVAEAQKEAQVEQLKTQVQTLQRQLIDLRSDLSSTKGALEFQRRSVTHILSQSSSLQASLSQSLHANKAQSAELDQLRTSYADLSSSLYTGTTHDASAAAEEISSLKSFLNRTDEYTGAQILQALRDLNTEIVQFSAAVSEEFALGSGGGGRGLWRESDYEIVRRAMGEGMCDLVKDGDHEQDPTVVQHAIQAWEVWCCRQVFEPFCWGAPPDVDRFLVEVFREMQLQEPQATTSRWRALTHMHVRNALSAASLSHSTSSSSTAPPLQSSDSPCPSALASPITGFPTAQLNASYPTPYSTTNNTPAALLPPLPNQISPTNSQQSQHQRTHVHTLSFSNTQHVPLPHQLRTRLSSSHDTNGISFPSPITPSYSQGSNGVNLFSPIATGPVTAASRSQHVTSNLRGILALLALAGCTDGRGIHREPLRERWGEQVERLLERAENLARIIREGVGSAWFEVCVESGPPLMREKQVKPEMAGYASAKGRGVRKASSSGKVPLLNGAVSGAGKETENAITAQDKEPWRRMYDATEMDNVYAGYGDENSRVLCTVEFGLAVVKRRRITETSQGGEDGVAAPVEVEVEAADGRAEELRKEMLERMLLLKPKVLLESVKELL